jgi:7-carboxy-7-deazaguanine synthase
MTWDWTGKNGIAYDRRAESHPMPVVDIAAAVKAMGVRLVVISGGEPVIQKRGIVALLNEPDMRGIFVEVETNGTLDPGELPAMGVRFNVSPKLANSGVAQDKAWRPALGAYVAAGANFKFVCQAPGDLDEVAVVMGAYGASPDQVWIMPEGRDVDTLARHTRALADAVVARGWNLTGRLQVTAWGDTRGT